MKVLCTLVDQNDNVIGSRDRTLLEPGDIYRITALWIINDKHEMLLAQRLMSKRNDPGKWGPAVAGTVEAGESYEQNVAKEAAEEIGLTGVQFEAGPKVFVADNGHGQGIFCQTFLAHCDWPAEQFTLQAEEVAAVKWMSIDALREQVRIAPEQFTTSFSFAFEQVMQSSATETPASIAS